MNSHGLLRTNVGLTTNVKLMVGTTYSLYLDSIVSTPELDISKYKKLEFNSKNYWDELVPFFFKNTPSDIAYKVKYDDDNDNMATDFSRQYDDIYQCGARNIINNKDYSEEYEYFAPLYIHKSSLPSNFIIFRTDGPGLTKVDKTNFHSEIINNLKCVKVFDLTRRSTLGEWLEFNITKNKNFPITPFYMDFRRLEFSSWFGIDFEDGGYSEKPFMLDRTLETEHTYYDFEKLVYDGFKSNKVVFPHIINFSFLFDDTPATPNSIRKWSLNRYLGFYLDDLELVTAVSPYILPVLGDDVVIGEYNILYSLSGGSPFAQSFKKEDFPYIEIDGKFYRVEKYIEKQNLQLQKVKISGTSYSDLPSESEVTKYKVISNINLSGKTRADINKNLIYIDSTYSNNKMTYYDTASAFILDGFDDADVWLIEIDGKLHNLIKGDDGNFYIKTDYAFLQSSDKFEYWINDPDPNYRSSISLKVDSQTPPKRFNIYRCKFSDIKDFDTDIIETEFSNHEYINKSKLTLTDETKMYTTNHESTSNPKDIDDYKISGSVVNIPAASEYTANGETFRLVDDKLSGLWRKNSERVKWGFQNSLSSNDYPYLLNNSFSAEDYNRTTNTFDTNPHRHERNLDYFLTINPSSNSYLHHSLHVIDDEVITFNDNGILRGNRVSFIGISNISAFSIGDLILIEQYPGYINAQYNTTASVTGIFYNESGNPCISTNIGFVSANSTPNGGTIKNLTRHTFALDRYLGINYNLDYFSYYFGKISEFDSGNLVKNTKKWSYFNSGDNATPNITLFRGIKFKLYDVDGVKINDGKVETINIKTSNQYDGYKFDILLSRNNYAVESSVNDPNIAVINKTDNLLRWKIIDEWKHDKIYESGQLVNYYDIIYKSLTQSQIITPSVNPSNSSEWTLFSEKTIFWSPQYNGSSTASSNLIDTLSNDYPPLVYNGGEYYYANFGSNINFWNPSTIYATNSEVIYGNKTWKSKIGPNSKIPGVTEYWLDTNKNHNLYWDESDSSTNWSIVELWKSNVTYDSNSSNWRTVSKKGYYVIYEDVVYVTIVTPNPGIIPPQDSSWKRVYSMVPDTNYSYGNNSVTLIGLNDNNIILMNNRLYFCNIADYNVNYMTGILNRTLEDGINIYINKKYKNILVNIYINDNTLDKLSDVDRDDLYSDLYSKLTAHNFMNAINDLDNKYDFSDNIRYVVINEDSTINIYDFNNLNSVDKLPVLLTCEGPDEFLTKIQSLVVSPVSLTVNEIKPKRKLDSGNIISLDQLNHYSEIHLATKIERVIEDPKKVPNYHGLKNQIYHKMYRHSGYYSPILNDVELFSAPGLTNSYGNYKFDTNLTFFGTIKERIVSKVNRKKNILKLKNIPNIKSVYPMLDEYGYHPTDFFIFKSTWDTEYHIECLDVPQSAPVQSNQSLANISIDNNTNNNNLSQL